MMVKIIEYKRYFLYINNTIQKNVRLKTNLLKRKEKRLIMFLF